MTLLPPSLLRSFWHFAHLFANFRNSFFTSHKQDQKISKQYPKIYCTVKFLAADAADSTELGLLSEVYYKIDGIKSENWKTKISDLMICKMRSFAEMCIKPLTYTYTLFFHIFIFSSFLQVWWPTRVTQNLACFPDSLENCRKILKIFGR